MNEKYQHQFDKFVANPLKDAVGKTLLAVKYFILKFDGWETNLTKAGNPHGCQGVLLTFTDSELELDWDWQPDLRSNEEDVSSSIAYHIVARSESLRKLTSPGVNSEEVYIEAVDASPSSFWEQSYGQILQCVSVWGIALSLSRYSPQAVCLQFPFGEVIVAIGQEDPLIIGDGDEVLVFFKPRGIHILEHHPLDGLECICRFPVEVIKSD